MVVQNNEKDFREKGALGLALCAYIVEAVVVVLVVWSGESARLSAFKFTQTL